jgi:hydrophobe/amphiphile efflux-1 (HAE1) family protein
MFSHFFIARPKFAMVIAALMLIAGALALTALPISQYPEITPPEVQVVATYPGANAEVVADTVAAPIEAEVNGVDDMIYMSSTSTNNGRYVLTVTFDVGTDPDQAAINVQNRVSLATPRLPSDVTVQGVSVRKRSSNMLMAVQLYAPQGGYDQVFISNYNSLNIRDAIARVPGVGEATILGAFDYSMRVWLNPERMTALGLTTQDVLGALRAQNVQASAGQIGGAPSPQAVQQLTISAKGRLTTPQEFGAIVLRTNPNGAALRLSDVARIELGAQSYEALATLNGSPASTLIVYQSPGANALAVATAVRAELDRLSRSFPSGLEHRIAYDTTKVVTATIEEIEHTLVLTFLIVIVVVYLFLQDWRATLIPTLAIPVSLVATFAVLYAMGFSLNTISLFAIVLAITLVVDDAIVVVENVQRLMEDDPSLSPAEATRRAMSQITGPVVATTLVLTAVFVPVAFLPGITGQLYRQFAVTIAVAVLFSGVNALTLSPALCALLLRRPKESRFPLLRGFNGLLDRTRRGYLGLVGHGVRRLAVTGALLAVTLLSVVALNRGIPTAFLPEEDQGYLFVNVQLPDGAALARTDAVMGRVIRAARATDGVADVLGVSGFSLLNGASASNAGLVIITLKDWEERRSEALHVRGVLARLQEAYADIPEAFILPINPPAIPGLGVAGGFEYQLLGQDGQDPRQMAAGLSAVLAEANRNPSLTGVYSTYSANVPQIELELDRTRMELLGVSPQAVFAALQSQLGAAYVNDFNILNRSFQVRLQNEAAFRDARSDIDNVYVRSSNDALVPLRSVVEARSVLGPDFITRFNQFPSIKIQGSAAPGVSSGQALAAMEALPLPDGFGSAWSGMSYQERLADGQTAMIMGLALLFGYLFLVAQYESWTVPIGVMLSVAAAILGSYLTLALVGLPSDIYAQIGLVLMLGLASKNAILIVEFAREKRDEGLSVADAALEAARERFRPVMMTVLAFVFGVLPLVVAEGAGAASRQSMGWTVFGGMIAAGTLGLVMVPGLYVVLQSLRERRTHSPSGRAKPNPEPQPAE